MAEDNVQALVAELSLNTRRIERQQTRLLKKFDSTFNSIEKTGGKRLANVERRAEEMSRNVRRAIAAIALGIAGREVTSYADAWTDLNNKVKAAGEVSGIQGRAMKELAADARATRSEIEPYVDLYSRILRAGKGVAESEAEVARVTQITAKAFAAGGASASEQAAGVLQLGQALGSGFLQGDELRSLRENAPLVAKAVADAMGVSIGGLKELGAQGKITSDVVFKALLDAEDVIDRAFSVTTPRASMEAVLAFDNLKLKVGEYLVEGGQVAAVSSAAAGAINFVADNLDTLSDAIIVGSAALAGFFGAQGLMAVASGLNSVAVGATAGAKALALLRAAGAFLTGPVGIAIGAAAVASGIAMIALGMGDVTEKSKTAEESILAVTDALGKYGEVNATIGRDLDTLKDLQDDLTKAIADQQPVIEATKRADIAALEDRIAKNRELAGVYEALARAELANAKENVGDIKSGKAKELLGRDAFNTEIIPASGLREGGVRKRLKPQAELNDLLRQEYERIKAIQDAGGDTTPQQAKILSFYSQRLAAIQKVADLEESVAALQAAGTGTGTKPGGGGGGGGGGASEEVTDALAEIDKAHRDLTANELEQIEQVKEARLDAIEAAGLSEQEAADERRKVYDLYANDLLDLSDKEVEKEKAAEDARQAAADRELALINQVMDARDYAVGRLATILGREYDLKKAQIEKEITDVDERNKALAALEEERYAAEADLRDQMLEQGQYSRDPLERYQAYLESEQNLLDDALENKLISEAEYQERLAELKQGYRDAEREAEISNQQQILSATQGFISALGQLAEQRFGKNSALTKAFFLAQQAAAAAQVVVSGEVAKIRALAELGPVAGPPAAAAIEIARNISLATIAAQTIAGFKDGVVGINGPGTGRSDDVGPIMVSRDESIITAEGTRKNRNLLERINAGEDVEAQLARAAQPVGINPAFLTVGGRQISIGGSSFVFQGPVDRSVLPDIEAMLDQRDRNLAKQFDAVLKRDKTFTTPRPERNRFFKD